MRWHSKTKSSYNPNIGDTRIVNIFAWIPILIGDKWVWLERVNILQEYNMLWEDDSSSYTGFTAVFDWRNIEIVEE